jgi:hypothetical protein
MVATGAGSRRNTDSGTCTLIALSRYYISHIGILRQAQASTVNQKPGRES